MGAFFQQRLEKPALVALAAVEGVGSSGVDKGLASRRSTVDDIKPALPIIRYIPLFPWFRALKVMQDLSQQQQ